MSKFNWEADGTGGKTRPISIKNGITVAIDGFVGVEPSTGRLTNCSDVADLVPAGVLIGNDRGLNNLLTGNAGGTNKASSKGKIILKGVSVTGVTGETNIGDKVYATDDETLNIAATNALVFGHIVGYNSNTSVDVRVLDYAESLNRIA